MRASCPPHRDWLPARIIRLLSASAFLLALFAGGTHSLWAQQWTVVGTEQVTPLPAPQPVESPAAEPIPTEIEQRDALRVQAIIAEPCCPGATTPGLPPGLVGSDGLPYEPYDGIVPVQDRESCLFIPARCGPVRCAPLEYWLDGGRVYFNTDLVALKRDQSGSVPFASLDNQPVLATEERNIPFSYGARFLAGVSLTPWSRIEGLYLGLTDWIDSAGVRNDSPNAIGGDGNLFSRLSNFGNPVGIPGIDYNTTAEIYYRSVFDNVELNWRHRLPAPAWMEVSFIFGARYISVRERFQFTTVADVPAPDGAINALGVGSGNDVIGAQIGGTLNAPIHDLWWIELELKGLLGHNNAGQTSVYTTTDEFGTTQNFTTGRRGTSTTYVGDLSLSIVCQCTRNIAARIGYQSIWVDGLVLASENVPTDVNVLTQGPPILVDDGNVVYHGPHAGLMITW